MKLRTGETHEYDNGGFEIVLVVGEPDVSRVRSYKSVTYCMRLPRGQKYGQTGIVTEEFLSDDQAIQSYLKGQLQKFIDQYPDIK